MAETFRMTDEDRRRLREMAEEMERNPYPREFKDFNWAKVAYYLGGKCMANSQTGLVLQMTKGFVLMQHHRFGVIELYDNGGEINLFAERPVMTEEQSAILSQLEATNIRANRFHVWHMDVSSVPYTSTLGYVTNVVLAYRIRMFLRQEPIDWDWMEKDPEYWTPNDNGRAWKENGPDGPLFNKRAIRGNPSSGQSMNLGCLPQTFSRALPLLTRLLNNPRYLAP